ncbi:MAG TPA: hypothetical protein DDY31_04950 [Lachnospiraceae bacterium]|nr:hypothetical protein [Lachnospiraceae bacterium]
MVLRFLFPIVYHIFKINPTFYFTLSSISLLKKAKKICYNKWGASPIIIHKTEVAYDTDM